MFRGPRNGLRQHSGDSDDDYDTTIWNVLQRVGMVFAEQPVGLCNAYAQSGTAPGNTAFPALDVCDPDFSDIDDAEQIASVTVAMEAKYLSKVSYLNSIQLLVGGTLYGSPQGPSANLQASPDSSLSYTFSTPGLTGDDLKASGFGVRTIFKRKVGKGIGAVAVDAVTLAATYWQG